VDVPQPSDAARPAIPVRASDADRERGAAVLRAATADGRLPADELDERLGLVYNAKSSDELASIVKDLQPAPWPGGSPPAAKDIGVLTGFVRNGRWAVADEYRATAVISSGVVDLRQVQFTAPETTMRVNSWVSTVYVIVPEDAEVHVTGTAILGGFRQDREGTGYPAAHRINVTGVAVCGSVLVVHHLPPAMERRIQRRGRKTN
jgi:Domain of unknown function (DUF1707)/Cell wall-active antibiotics response 4TMS YvqF